METNAVSVSVILVPLPNRSNSLVDSVRPCSGSAGGDKVLLKNKSDTNPSRTAARSSWPKALGLKLPLGEIHRDLSGSGVGGAVQSCAELC
jgi:hypothetical protein